MLLKDLPQFAKFRREFRIGFRDLLQIGQKFPDFLVVVDRVDDKVLGFLMFPQNREEMLLLKAGERFQLILEFREQLFPRLDSTIRRIRQLAEKLIGLGWTVLDELSDCNFSYP
jgi:hypothetical protein